jgi:hypothetical protein
MNGIKTSGLYIIMILFLSCSHDSCPLSAGSVSSELRSLAQFNEIDLYGKINVILTQDTVQNIRVEAGKNLLAGISTNVSGGTLTIQDNNGCKLLRTDNNISNVYISIRQLQKITYYGSGNVSSTDTIRSAFFTVDCYYGSGTINLKLVADTADAIVRTENADIIFSGHGDFAYVYAAEASSVNLFQYTTHTVNIISKSIRDIDVYVTDSLNASILYKGDVYYMGNPSSILTQISNSGQLIHVP